MLSQRLADSVADIPNVPGIVEREASVEGDSGRAGDAAESQVRDEVQRIACRVQLAGLETVSGAFEPAQAIEPVTVCEEPGTSAIMRSRTEKQEIRDCIENPLCAILLRLKEYGIRA